MSDTPLTDDEAQWTCACDEAFKAVHADFSRLLERHARAMAEAAESYVGIGFDIADESAELKKAIAAWREFEKGK